ncbi:MAG: DEAD/DEAH box helicase [Dehalococcoidaceae bacterium]|nr:DEAD/DEAH box helicase [Dehalococcoidaceae bacterium]
MNPEEFLAYITSQPFYKGQICHTEDISSRQAVPGEPEKAPSAPMKRALMLTGAWPLYSHQAEAVNLVSRGLNVIIATPSSSGKSLAYNIPVLEALLENPSVRALYLFPTKALAQDQLRSVCRLAESAGICGFTAMTYDGDTPCEERSRARSKAGLIITNPDMLHLGILPRHSDWGRFLARLKYVVLDEAHVYRGVFGSNVALVMRRLRRLCRLYGSDPVFILCSATIANPQQQASSLTGLPFEVVEKDGSPGSPREFVFWNPPCNEAGQTGRKSTNSEAAMLFSEMVSHDIRSLAFTRTRRLTELIYTYARDQLKKNSPEHALRIKPYRAGYIPQVRRRIEKELSTGELTGVVATNALELGIDIGQLDATIIAGYPGSIASTWQQAGRSGRRGRKALTVLVGRDDPLDQYLMSHPEAFFGRQFENALINPDNPYILKRHLACAAWEYPLQARDEGFFGPGFQQALESLENEVKLTGRRGKWYVHPSMDYPAQSVDIRSSSGQVISIIDTASGSLIDTVERSTALFQAHEGAIYLNQGESYLVTQLDLSAGNATVKPVDAEYYTVADDLTTLKIIQQQRYKNVGDVKVCLGQVEVTTSVIAYKRKEQYSERLIDQKPLDLPDEIFSTIGLWFDITPDMVSRLARDGLDLAGGLHAVEHACIGLLPLFAMCDRLDIGGVSTILHEDTGKPQVFIYDACPGGIGIAEKGYEIITRLWEATLKLISNCGCEEGCPSCIQSPKCGNNNEPLDKAAARQILKMLLY